MTQTPAAPETAAILGLHAEHAMRSPVLKEQWGKPIWFGAMAVVLVCKAVEERGYAIVPVAAVPDAALLEAMRKYDALYNAAQYCDLTGDTAQLQEAFNAISMAERAAFFAYLTAMKEPA